MNNSDKKSLVLINIKKETLNKDVTRNTIILDESTNRVYIDCYYNEDNWIEGCTFKANGESFVEPLSSDPNDLKELTLGVYVDNDLFNVDGNLCLNIKNGHWGVKYSIDKCYHELKEVIKDNDHYKATYSGIINPEFYFKVVPSYNLKVLFIHKYNQLLSSLDSNFLASVRLELDNDMIGFYVRKGICIKSKPTKNYDYTTLEKTKKDSVALF